LLTIAVVRAGVQLVRVGKARDARAVAFASHGGERSIVLFAGALVVCAGCARSNERARASRLDGDPLLAASSVLHVPHAPAPIVLDGDSDDPGWITAPGPARTGPFVSPAGGAARPYSDARLVWGDGHLYVLLYAADEDVRSRSDAFRMAFFRDGATYAVAISASGAVHDEARDAEGRVDARWRSGTHVSREIDGTLDDPRDTDEEWSLEIALPLASLGMNGERGERVGFSVDRCDAPDRSQLACGGWIGEGRDRGQLVLE
jgi:hypothetical protein